ncbi:MAG: SDR family oxidoreductase [Solirubrobacteraceae bacterium]
MLVLGATGMVGQAVMAAARERGLEVSGAARTGAEHMLDIRDDAALGDLLRQAHPDVVVNCAAIVSHAICEAQPGLAYMVNARAPGVIAELLRDTETLLVQVSTDHYWVGDADAKHAEDAPVRLVNEYARSKYVGELLAATSPHALVVRTNVTGMRGVHERPTFIEWVLQAVRSDQPMQLFHDFYTSTIDAPALAEALLDLSARRVTGLLNVASCEVASKEEFITAVARELGVEMPPVDRASVIGLRPLRAESLGLDVTRAERLFGRSLPTLAEAVRALVSGARP